MSRDIKFRQKLNERASKINGEAFHYWGYIDGTFVAPMGKNYVDGDDQQYTGLKDLAGIDIYDGDYVSLWYAPRATAKGWIKFENGAFYFKTKEAKPSSCVAYDCVYEHGNYFTVIGNIHQNPELLESE